MKRLFIVAAATVVLLHCGAERSMAQKARACIYCAYVVQAGMYGENTLYFLNKEVTISSDAEKKEYGRKLEALARKMDADFAGRGRSDDGSYVKTRVAWGVYFIPGTQTYEHFIFNIESLLNNKSEEMLPGNFYGQFKYVISEELDSGRL